MNILVAITHYWNPDGGGRHQSLCSDPVPRVTALQQLLLSLRRLSSRQCLLDIASRSVEPCNADLAHNITMCVVTNGDNHVLDLLSPEFDGSYVFVSTHPSSPKHLGYEAQLLLASFIDKGFDMFCYLEDDLVINDPLFFHKVFDFQASLGSKNVLLPHRIEMIDYPSLVDRFYIDGSLAPEDLTSIIPDPPSQVTQHILGRDISFTSPSNPHSGCYFLTAEQMRSWMDHSSWCDGDDSWVSPLESAATLGISKVFNLYKPSVSNASWLEIQHWGSTFHSKIVEAPPFDHDPELER